MDVATNVTVEKIVQHAKGNDDREAIITEKLKNQLKWLLYKEDKNKKERAFGGRSSFGL